MRVRPVDAPRCQLGENALWDSEAQVLWYFDIFGHKVLRHDPASGATETRETPGQPGAMALSDGGGSERGGREGGGLVLAMHDTLYTFDFASGACERLAGPAFDEPKANINDGAVDRRGRFVFGGSSAEMGDPGPIGGLFVLDGGAITRLDEGIHQSNSHCFSPDGRTLYAADSHLKTLFAYDYHLDSGRVAGKRPFVRTDALGGVPDGSTVDQDGLVWSAIFDAGKVAAFRPDGTIERTVDLPVSLPSSVAFGGPQRDILYVTTIDPAAFGRPGEAGGGLLFAIEGLGAKGLPEPRYRG